MPNAFLSSNKQDYATPWPLVEAIENKLGRRFTLDVCASEKSAKAPKFYTEADNGLTQPWAKDAAGGMAWCNPPYGDGKILSWIGEADSQSYYCGLITIFLLPANKVDQPWWHDMVIPNHQVWTVRGRVDFLDPETGEVPLTWKWNDHAKRMYLDVSSTAGVFIGDPIFGKWVKQTNPQASVIVIVGPDFRPCPPVSFVWR